MTNHGSPIPDPDSPDPPTPGEPVPTEPMPGDPPAPQPSPDLCRAIPQGPI